MKKKPATTENSIIHLNIEYRLSSALWCNYYILFFATINLHCRDDGSDDGCESGESFHTCVLKCGPCWYSTYHMLLFLVKFRLEIF